MILNILHTNDIHSNYENFSKIVGKIRELKDENTIILDAGDFADFKRLELQGTGGVAAVELLQCAGYNAIAIGNNETFNGLETLINMATKSKVPFLSSNLYKLGFEPIEGVRKSFILNNNGLRILIIGASPDLGAFTTLAGLEAKDYVEAVREEIKTNEGSYDVCILLSHLGMDRDKEIAEKAQGVDVIVGGHFHILMDNPEIINNTIIHTSGCYGEHIGMLKIKIEDKKVELIEGKNILIEGCSSSEDIIQILKENKEKAIDNLSKPLYSIDVDLWHDVIEENPMTNLLADALVDVLNCDIGIINSGVLNGGIRKGPVSIKKLLEVCPSPLNPTTFEIEGKYIREALENSMDSDICLMDGKGPGFRGRYLGRLHLSNAIVEHDGRRIKNILIKGEPLQDNKVYTVATSDYLQRGTGYSSLKSNVNEKYNEEYLRDTLREYVEKSEFVQRAFVHRWILK
jgi:5'-nucleotidase